MNISTLEQYVDQKNRWGAIFGSAPLSLLNAKDRQTIADSLDSDLSPENVSCDGEIQGRALIQKRNALIRAARELYSIDPSVRMYEAEGWF
jgi:hypothetical protein